MIVHIIKIPRNETTRKNYRKIIYLNLVLIFSSFEQTFGCALANTCIVGKHLTPKTCLKQKPLIPWCKSHHNSHRRLPTQKRFGGRLKIGQGREIIHKKEKTSQEYLPFKGKCDWIINIILPSNMMPSNRMARQDMLFSKARQTDGNKSNDAPGAVELHEPRGGGGGLGRLVPPDIRTPRFRVEVAGGSRLDINIDTSFILKLKKTQINCVFFPHFFSCMELPQFADFGPRAGVELGIGGPKEKGNWNGNPERINEK